MVPVPSASADSLLPGADGWFSSNSAKVYDSSTESLFLGRQDAMQRSTLVHLHRAFAAPKTANFDQMDQKPISSAAGGGLKFLEVGAGTGRFATFVRDNFPQAEMTVSELSPFYLQEAKEAMERYESVRRHSGCVAVNHWLCAV